MAAQGAMCSSLPHSRMCSSSHAFRIPYGHAKAHFFGSKRPFCSVRKHPSQKYRSARLVQNGLFDFLNPGQGSGASDKLVSEILEAARGTNGGSKANAETREEIEELVRACPSSTAA